MWSGVSISAVSPFATYDFYWEEGNPEPTLVMERIAERR
jgi:hypothetical protein